MQTRGPRLAFLLTLAVVVAGCSSAEPPASSSGPSTSASPTSGAPGSGPTAVLSKEVVLYLTSEHKLSTTKPSSAARVAETASFYDPTVQASTGIPVPPWLVEMPLTEGWRVTSLKADIYVTSDGPQTCPLCPGVGNPWVVWVGEDRVTGPTQSIPGPMAITPGQVVRFEADLAVPPGGLVYLPSGVPAVRLGYFYAPSTADPLFILVGADQASSLRLTISSYVAPAQLGSSQTRTTGAFEPGVPMHEVPFAVPSTDVWIFAELVGSGTAARTDLDLSLLDPSGAQVWASTGPDAHETIRVYEVNLREGGTGGYTFRINNFQSVQGSYTFVTTVTQVAPAAATT